MAVSLAIYFYFLFLFILSFAFAVSFLNDGWNSSRWSWEAKRKKRRRRIPLPFLFVFSFSLFSFHGHCRQPLLLRFSPFRSWVFLLHCCRSPFFSFCCPPPRIFFFSRAHLNRYSSSCRPDWLASYLHICFCDLDISLGLSRRHSSRFEFSRKFLGALPGEEHLFFSINPLSMYVHWPDVESCQVLSQYGKVQSKVSIFFFLPSSPEDVSSSCIVVKEWTPEGLCDQQDSIVINEIPFRHCNWDNSTEIFTCGRSRREREKRMTENNQRFCRRKIFPPKTIEESDCLTDWFSVCFSFDSLSLSLCQLSLCVSLLLQKPETNNSHF